MCHPSLTCRLDEVEPAHGIEQPVEVLSNEAPFTSLVPHIHSRPRLPRRASASVLGSTRPVEPSAMHPGTATQPLGSVGDVHLELGVGITLDTTEDAMLEIREGVEELLGAEIDGAGVLLDTAKLDDTADELEAMDDGARDDTTELDDTKDELEAMEDDITAALLDEELAVELDVADMVLWKQIKG
ncbi:hypothetical protein QFC22_000213 [Naganishia vaughanmartiniae]|uniref:Uncharacterized protein n=1 Tax=Naganishia vaughanmartiniae TaxID=1424756 RepID=A0ACC2XMQ0_9TREE|nr:hypothetical protein QFC22_000213 [Naganishia vaughanmartiniae]